MGRWSRDEIRLLRKIFPDRTTALVAVQLNRSVASVKAKASALGLRKTKRCLKAIRNGNVRQASATRRQETIYSERKRR